MSRKTQTAAAILAASLLAGSVSVAASEAPRRRPIDLENGRAVLVQMFDWVRTVLGARHDSGRTALPPAGSRQKDVPTLDPNGHK